MPNKLFWDFDYDYEKLGEQLSDNWYDNSNKNDACPKFSHEAEGKPYYDLWFDYEDPELSEWYKERKLGTTKQFVISNKNGEEIFMTNDFNKILDWTRDHDL